MKNITAYSYNYELLVVYSSFASWIPNKRVQKYNFILNTLKPNYAYGSDNGLSPVKSHYLNQCWLIVDMALRSKRQRNTNQNTIAFVQKSTFKIYFAQWLPFFLDLSVLPHSPNVVHGALNNNETDTLTDTLDVQHLYESHLEEK